MAGDNDIPLQADSVTEKRGRGRPRKPGALTNAQRQAAFRARHKAAGKPVTVTKNEHDELVRECERLREELAKTRRGIAKRNSLKSWRLAISNGSVVSASARSPIALICS